MAEDFVKRLMLTLLSDKCYDEYFNNYNFMDVPCFKSTLSKGLGIGIIAGSILVKVPQILKILSNKSAEGLNFYGVLLELFAITATFAYSYVMQFPFSAWGDATFLAVQTAIIAALILHYGGAAGKAASFLAVYSALVAVLISDYTPLDVLWFLQASNVPVVLFAKSIQIVTNLKNSSTGQLSAITCFLLFGGSVARIFTSIQETGDLTLVITYCVASVANGILVAQLLWYWNSEKKMKKKKRK